MLLVSNICDGKRSHEWYKIRNGTPLGILLRKCINGEFSLMITCDLYIVQLWLIVADSLHASYVFTRICSVYHSAHGDEQNTVHYDEFHVNVDAFHEIQVMQHCETKAIKCWRIFWIYGPYVGLQQSSNIEICLVVLN